MFPFSYWFKQRRRDIHILQTLVQCLSNVYWTKIMAYVFKSTFCFIHTNLSKKNIHIYIYWISNIRTARYNIYLNFQNSMWYDECDMILAVAKGETKKYYTSIHIGTNIHVYRGKGHFWFPIKLMFNFKLHEVSVYYLQYH